MTRMSIRAGYRGISPSKRDLTYHRQKLQQNTNICDSFYLGCSPKEPAGFIKEPLEVFLGYKD